MLSYPFFFEFPSITQLITVGFPKLIFTSLKYVSALKPKKWALHDTQVSQRSYTWMRKAVLLARVTQTT